MFQNFNLWQAIKIGGPITYLLIVCSIISVAVILERFYCYYVRSHISRTRFMKHIREQLEYADIKKVLTTCHNAKTPFAAVVAAGLNAIHLDEKEITEAMERETLIQANSLQQHTALLGTIGSTAVYIGLLGTVWGIIWTFRDIAQMGAGGINVVIHGIAEALVCTAAGLVVAIPAVAAYNYFVRRVDAFVMDMELCASELVSLIRAKQFIA